MPFKNLGYFWLEAWKSLGRSPLMTMGAVLTIAISLFLLGAFSLLVLNADFIGSQVESDVEIVVWVEETAGEDQIQELGRNLEGLSGVASVTLVTKEEGLRQMQEMYGAGHDLLAALGGVNPLPDYYRVKAQDPRQVPQLAGLVERLQHVDAVDYGQGEIERLFNVLEWIRLLGAGIVAILAVAAVTLVSLSIRINVMARQKEIEIMRYVGATEWFIRWPFVLEGFFMGLFGSALAGAAVYLGYDYLLSTMAGSIGWMTFINDQGLVLKLAGGLVLGGVFLGVLGSAVSVRRFLKV